MEKALKPVEKLKSIMKAPSVEEQFRTVLKDNTEAFVAGIIDLYNTDDKLQECNPKEVVMEALKGAVLKLPINKGLGFAYIVPYKGRPQFQVGYKGYVQLAMRTGQYRILNTDEVYEGELKSINKLTGEISFEGEKKSDTVVGYFAHMELINGFSKTLFMTKENVQKHTKKYSKSYSYANSPWQTEFDAMAKKTVLRNLLSHYGYLSVEMIGAIDKDSDEVREQRDEMLEKVRAKKTLDFEDAQYEEVKEEKPVAEKPEVKEEKEHEPEW